jgi:hypothetical protein
MTTVANFMTSNNIKQMRSIALLFVLLQQAFDIYCNNSMLNEFKLFLSIFKYENGTYFWNHVIVLIPFDLWIGFISYFQDHLFLMTANSCCLIDLSVLASLELIFEIAFQLIQATYFNR